MQTEYSVKPESILYMPLPNGQADVWLRENIEEVTVEAGETLGDETVTQTKWVADEVYCRTSLTEEEVTANFDEIFENGGVVVDEETGEEVADGITLSDRMDAAEAAIDEMAELLAEVIG